MESAQSLGEKELYGAGDFGDTRLKKRRCSVPANAVPTNRLPAASGGKQGA